MKNLLKIALAFMLLLVAQMPTLHAQSQSQSIGDYHNAILRRVIDANDKTPGGLTNDQTHAIMESYMKEQGFGDIHPDYKGFVQTYLAGTSGFHELYGKMIANKVVTPTLAGIFESVEKSLQAPNLKANALGRILANEKNTKEYAQLSPKEKELYAVFCNVALKSADFWNSENNGNKSASAPTGAKTTKGCWCGFPSGCFFCVIINDAIGAVIGFAMCGPGCAVFMAATESLFARCCGWCGAGGCCKSISIDCNGG